MQVWALQTSNSRVQDPWRNGAEGPQAQEQCCNCKGMQLWAAFSHCNHSMQHTAQQSILTMQVDADKHKSLGERFGVRGFPTLKWFPRGKPVSNPEE